MLYADQAAAAGAHLQARLLVRHRKFRRSALRQYRPVARQSRQHRHPAPHRGNYSIYAVADQMVWAGPERSRPHPQRVRARDGNAAGRPQPDRFQPQCRADLPRAVPASRRRHVRHRHGLRQGQRPRRRRSTGTPRFFTGAFTPARSSETFLEVTYQYAGDAVAAAAARFPIRLQSRRRSRQSERRRGRVKNEAVLGLRTNILF